MWRAPFFPVFTNASVFLRRKKIKYPASRLNQKTIAQYKTMGKEYTGIMAAVLDYAIKHPDVL
jgi:hypothetical protein